MNTMITSFRSVSLAGNTLPKKALAERIPYSFRKVNKAVRRSNTTTICKSSIKVTYFPIEAAAEKIRLALVMTGTPFEDERIPFPEWAELKPKTKYGQLPFLTVDGKEMYQSMALMKWVARKFGDGTLYPQDPDQQYLVEEALNLSDDLARAWNPALYIGMNHQSLGHPQDWAQKDETVKAMREKFVAESLPMFMKYLSDMIEGSDGDFLCGKHVTVADLVWLPQLRFYTKGVADYVPADCLDEYTTVTAYMSRVMEVPQIKEWYSTEK